METNKASIKRGDKQASLVLNVHDQDFEIVLTDDNPINVKKVFNNLLKELKKGLFKFNLEDTTEDLYYHICKEYLTQLNSELKSVYDELKGYELLDD